MARRFFTRLRLKGGRVVDYLKDVLAEEDLPRPAGLTPGTYTNADVTVDQFGRVVAVANGTGGGGTSGVLEQVWAALDGNADPIDTVIQSGSFVAFVYFSSHNANSWKSASSTYAVPVGKTLIVVHRFTPAAVGDVARDARLFNVTDSSVVDSVNGNDRRGGIIPWSGDDVATTKLPTAAAGKVLRAEIWNSNTFRRAFGVVYVCRIV